MPLNACGVGPGVQALDDSAQVLQVVDGYVHLHYGQFRRSLRDVQHGDARPQRIHRFGQRSQDA